MKSYLITSLLALLLTLQPLIAYADSISGKVIGVLDGDTITVQTPDKREIKIRLAGIDAPDNSQPYGETSKQFLSSLVFGKEVTIVSANKYEPTIARVFIDGNDVNLALVKTGHAWVYRLYITDDAILSAEGAAKNGGVGLWGLPEDQRIPPWKWLDGRRQYTEGADQKKEDTVYCSMESRQCPDGTWMFRTGPNCGFPACPSANESETPAKEPVLQKEEGAFFCSKDARVCPDGSITQRTGPNCEFAPCDPPVQRKVELP